MNASFQLNINNLPKIIIYIILTFLLSCTGKHKKSPLQVKKEKVKNDIQLDYLHVRHGKPIGILRVECNDCSLNYSMNNIDSVINIKNGNQDRFLFPKKKSLINTRLYSGIDQMIRILLIDPNGNIIYNVLDHFKNGELSSNKFLMQYTKKSNTVILSN